MGLVAPFPDEMGFEKALLSMIVLDEVVEQM